MSLMTNAHDLPSRRNLSRTSLQTRATRLALAAAVVLVPVLAAGAQDSAPPQQPEQLAPATQQAGAPPTTRPTGDDPFATDTPIAPPDAINPQDPSVNFNAASETVEINVSDANLLDVLRMLSMQSRKNIIASKNVSGTVSCNLFDVTIEEALAAILHSNGFVSREEGSFIYVYTAEEAAAMKEAARRMETRVFRLYHITAKMASEAIIPALSEGHDLRFSEESEEGVGSSRDDAGGLSYSANEILIVNDYPEHLEAATLVIQELDQRPEQVLIEATILSTKLTEANAFGVDFNVVGGVDFSQFTHNNGQVTGPADINGSDVATGFDNPTHGVGTGTNFTGPINGGLKVGFVSNNVSAFVAALEGTTDTSVLANPKVLALNKQRGEVLVGREDGYLTTTLTETTATQSVEFLQTGTRLIFRPFISNDGYIRLEIHPEDSTGGLNSSNLPFKSTTEVTTNVLVKDGHTIVIGGLFRDNSTVNRSQIPVLGNLPWVGPLFRRQGDVTEREEIIILLTPHVVKDLERYGQISEQELKRAEKLRVGTRKGMMPTGRERMSQVFYERAVREMANDRPNRKRASFYLNAALNLNPTFIEAIELKEKLTGRVVVEADDSTVRSFVRRSILHDVTEGGGPLPTDRPDRDPVLPGPQDVLPVSVDGAPATQPTTQPTTLPTTRPDSQWVDTKE